MAITNGGLLQNGQGLGLSHAPPVVQNTNIRHPPYPRTPMPAAGLSAGPARWNTYPPLVERRTFGGLSADGGKGHFLPPKCRSLGQVEPLPESRLPLAFHYRLLSFRTNQ